MKGYQAFKRFLIGYDQYIMRKTDVRKGHIPRSLKKSQKQQKQTEIKYYHDYTVEKA